MNYRLIMFLIFFSLTSCGSTPENRSEKPAGEKPGKATNGSSDATPAPTTKPTPKPEPEPEPSPIPSPEPEPTHFETTLECSISIDDNQSIWSSISYWKENTDQFVDRTAKWIAPSAMITDSSGFIMCPEVNSSLTTVYYNNFSLNAEDSLFFEFMNDNSGVITIVDDQHKTMATWEGSGNYASHSLTLNTGLYHIIVSNNDQDVASAILLSSQRSNKDILLNTATNQNWCVFTIPSTDDAIDYIINKKDQVDCLK